MSTYSERENLAQSAGFFDLLSGSYARLVGTELVPAGCDASWLYLQAPFALVAHNTDDDPRFIYANEAAQRCFGYSWDEFVLLRSRFSAETPERAERQRLLETVASQGFVADYSGVRVSKSGGRFWIRGGVIWQLVDEQGVTHGQAALFRSWENVNG